MIPDPDNTAQQKLKRVFDMLNMITTNRVRTDRVASRLGVSERTVYRYVRLIESIGFTVSITHEGITLETKTYPPFMKQLIKNANEGEVTTQPNPPTQYYRNHHNAALAHAYAMGKDYVLRGPTAENTQFERRSSSELKRAWERGKIEAEEKLKTKTS